MGLLSDFADSINAQPGGLPGLLGWPQPTTSSLLPGLAGLLPQQGQPSPPGVDPSFLAGPAGAPGMSMSAGAPADSGASLPPPSPQPAVGTPSPASPPQSAQPGPPSPPPQASPRSSGGLLGTVESGLGNLVKLPFNLINAYAADYGDVPSRIAFAQAKRAYELRGMQQGQAVLQSALGPGGLFDGSSPPPSAPQVVSAPPPASGPMPSLPLPTLTNAPTSAGQPPSPVGAISGPNAAPPTLQPGGPTAPTLGPTPLNAPRLPSAPGQPASAPGFNLRDPRTQRLIAALDLVGNPAGAALTTMGTALLPKYSTVRPGGMVLNENTGQLEGSSAPDNGTYNVPDGQGGYRNVAVPGALENQAALTGANAGAKAAGEAVGELPYAQALATARAAGQGAGEAPYDLQTRTGPNGEPITASRSWFLKHPQVGPTPAGTAFATSQAGGLNDALTADQSARQTAMAQRDAGLRAITIASQTPFNPAAPTLYKARQIASMLGVPSKEMDNVAAYKQLSTQAILSYARGNLPTRYTQRELDLVKPVIGSISDPNSAALIAAGLQTSMANKAVARAQFADGYNPQQSGVSRQSYESGWAASPAGHASLFADPVWSKIQLGGKPAVVPYSYKGRNVLLFGTGLGKPTVIPAN